MDLKHYKPEYYDEIYKIIQKQNNIEDVFIKTLYNQSFISPINEITKTDIQIFDNIIDDTSFKDICHFFKQNLLWRRHGSIQEKRFFRSILFGNRFFHTFFYKQIIPQITTENKQNLRIARAYVNLHIAGDGGGNWHYDIPASGPSVIVYCNENWETNWDGQTAFYSNIAKKKILYVDPAPGRVVVFNPLITHRACDMSGYAREKNVSRFTLVFMTYYKDKCSKNQLEKITQISQSHQISY